MSRLWQIIKEAYAQEKQALPAKLHIEQKDFLPAALEILEKPASPIGRATIWIICAFFTIALIWSVVGKMDVVAVAQGKVVPVGQSKIVQSFESGLVSAIHVYDGSFVHEGDALIELDATHNAADIARLNQQWQTAKLLASKNRWLLASLKDEHTAYDPQIALSDETLHIQQLLAHSQLSEYLATQSAYDEQMAEKHAERQLILSEIDKIKQTLPLLKEQVEGFKQLAQEGVSPRFKYLEYEEALIARQQDQYIQQNRQQQIEASIRSLKKQQEKHQQEHLSNTVAELSQAHDESVAAEQELIKARQTQQLQIVRAPVTGVVQQLAMNTVGGVVRATDPLMVIVPQDRQLQVEANILNKDIGFVAVGDRVEIKLEAFPFTKYGVIDGHILSIDHDAVEDEQLGLVYPSRISMKADKIRVAGDDVAISPGMGITAEVKIGERRLIEFVLSPLFKYKQESLRER